MKHFLLQAPLSQTRAQEILNAYGATPERWPEEERQALVELLAQSPELQTIQKTAIELDMLERMQVVWKENTERHAHELEKLQQDNANLKKTCDTLQEKARTLEESSQKASRDHSTAMKETEQRAAETNQLWQEIKRLEKQLAGAEKQHAIFKKEIQMKSETIDDLKNEADVLALEKEKVLLEHEQTKREYAATKEAFVHHKELMKYKSSMETQRTHEIRKQQALAHSLTHSITQKQMDELNEKIAKLEEEKTNMLETYNFFMETHGAHIAQDDVMKKLKDSDHNEEEDEGEEEIGFEEGQDISEMDEEERLAAVNREIDRLYEKVLSPTRDTNGGGGRASPFKDRRNLFMTPPRSGDENTAGSQALIVRRPSPKNNKGSGNNQQVQSENDCTVLCSPS